MTSLFHFFAFYVTSWTCRHNILFTVQLSSKVCIPYRFKIVKWKMYVYHTVKGKGLHPLAFMYICMYEYLAVLNKGLHHP